jgi:purine operon repressor
VRYLPFPVSDGCAFIEEMCRRLADPTRVLPGGYLYINDILSSPTITDKLGRMLASQFYKADPDFVLTVETKGIPLAMATARALGINSVICRREQQSGLDLPYVSINYISGSSGRLQTMSLAKKLVKEGQRALIIDDFMKAGGTARGMMEMMREFSITVVGIGMMITREVDTKKRVEDVKSLMIVREIDEETGADIVPASWIKQEDSQ